MKLDGYDAFWLAFCAFFGWNAASFIHDFVKGLWT